MWRRVAASKFDSWEPIECRPWKACETPVVPYLDTSSRKDKRKRKRIMVGLGKSGQRGPNSKKERNEKD